MDVLEAIRTRRSVRKFTDTPVTEEQIHAILAAAMTAPTAGNGQCWRFVVITDKNLLARIPDVQPHARMAAQSSVTFIVCADLHAEKYPDRPFWPQDASAAMQNMLLAAHGLGLGACWCGLHPVDEWERGIAELAGLPDHVRALGLCAVGHAAVIPEPADRFDSEKVHYNHW